MTLKSQQNTGKTIKTTRYITNTLPFCTHGVFHADIKTQGAPLSCCHGEASGLQRGPTTGTNQRTYADSFNTSDDTQVRHYEDPGCGETRRGRSVSCPNASHNSCPHSLVDPADNVLSIGTTETCLWSDGQLSYIL